ncbi:hypothetical protein ILYODFUR_001755 [Ilyodon furcidens]|uniref:Uncharacterized protein n=1 Tax=Ilyodon furcidens TaxID=33524 RepID=A0ABV0TJ76_9TELE
MVVVHRVLYPSIFIENLVEGTCDRKWCPSNRHNPRIWGSFTRNRLRLESEHQDPLRSDESYTGPTSVLPGLRRNRTGLILSGPKFYFQIKVTFTFHSKIKVPESGGRVERHRIHVA